MNSNIIGIGTANPRHKIQQSEVAEFMVNALPIDEETKIRLKTLYRATGIHERYTVIEDYVLPKERWSVFPSGGDLEPFPSISKRMQIYKTEAIDLCINAINDCLKSACNFDKNKITHLITVSCTGMYAPGIDIEIIEKLNLNKQIQRTSVNFMGCYAAFNALKIAGHICSSDPKANVLVVCVELCSIHFRKDLDDDTFLANAIFSDGAAAALLSGCVNNGVNLKLKKFHCDISYQGKRDMAWQIGDYGFEMKLSTYVPDIIKGNIAQLTHELLDALNLDIDEVDYFAIHPGGRKILEVIEKELRIKKENIRFSYQVLKNYGNMSSPTILFVLKEIWKNLVRNDNGKNILGVAFGPGLTLESMLLEIDWNSN